MNRVSLIVVSVVTLCAIAIVSVTLAYDFGGNAPATLVAAIFGFVTPTVAALLALAQAVLNYEKTQAVANQVADVNAKVDGHLARLTQVVVDNAARDTPIDAATVKSLAEHTALLTGQVIALPKPKGETP